MNRVDPDLDVDYGPLLPRERGARILDVGCGEGRVLRYLRSAGYDEALGIDTDPDAVAVAERQHPGSARHIASLEAFCQDHPGAFDMVVARQVIYYFSPVVAALECLRSVLVPGGTLIAEVFNGSLVTGPYVKHKDHRIQCVFTETSLHQTLLDAGYSEVRISGTKLAPKGAGRMAFRAANAAWGTMLRAVFILERGVDPGNPHIVSKSLLASARQGAR